MIKWMYKVEYSMLSEGQLEVLGQQGWELVAINHHPDCVRYYFKQPATKSTRQRLGGLNEVGKILKGYSVTASEEDE